MDLTALCPGIIYTCNYRIFYLMQYLLLFFMDFNFILLLNRFCHKDSLDKHVVKGKIVLCESLQGVSEVGVSSGAAGVIFDNVVPRNKDLTSTFALPTTILTKGNLNDIQYYISSTRYRFYY